MISTFLWISCGRIPPACSTVSSSSFDLVYDVRPFSLEQIERWIEQKSSSASRSIQRTQHMSVRNLCDNSEACEHFFQLKFANFFPSLSIFWCNQRHQKFSTNKRKQKKCSSGSVLWMWRNYVNDKRFRRLWTNTHEHRVEHSEENSFLSYLLRMKCIHFSYTAHTLRLFLIYTRGQANVPRGNHHNIAQHHTAFTHST